MPTAIVLVIILIPLFLFQPLTGYVNKINRSTEEKPVHAGMHAVTLVVSNSLRPYGL